MEAADGATHISVQNRNVNVNTTWSHLNRMLERLCSISLDFIVSLWEDTVGSDSIPFCKTKEHNSQLLRRNWQNGSRKRKESRIPPPSFFWKRKIIIIIHWPVIPTKRGRSIKIRLHFSKFWPCIFYQWRPTLPVHFQLGAENKTLAPVASTKRFWFPNLAHSSHDILWRSPPPSTAQVWPRLASQDRKAQQVAYTSYYLPFGIRLREGRSPELEVIVRITTPIHINAYHGRPWKGGEFLGKLRDSSKTIQQEISSH